MTPLEKTCQLLLWSGAQALALSLCPKASLPGPDSPPLFCARAPVGPKQFLTPDVSRSLAEAEYVTLRFHYRGFGESEGPPCRLILLEQVEDIGNAITFTQQQPEVDVGWIRLWGVATGGANVSHVAGIDARGRCVVSVSGMADLGGWMGSFRRYWEWVEFVRMIEAHRVARVLTGFSRHVETKEIVVRDPATDLFARRAGEMATGGQLGGRGRGLLAMESAGAMVEFRPEAVVDRISPRAAMWILGCSVGPLVRGYIFDLSGGDGAAFAAGVVSMAIVCVLPGLIKGR